MPPLYEEFEIKMNDRAHIRIGSPPLIIGKFDGPNGFSRLEDGRRVDISQAPIGYQIENDKLVAYTLTTNDTSTGPDIVRTDTGDVIAPDNSEVTRTITIRDMTAQEIEDRETEGDADAERGLDNNKALKALARAIWHTEKGTAPAQAFDSPANYKAWLRSLMR